MSMDSLRRYVNTWESIPMLDDVRKDLTVTVSHNQTRHPCVQHYSNSLWPMDGNDIVDVGSGGDRKTQGKD
jgi:hypothetical protein